MKRVVFSIFMIICLPLYGQDVVSVTSMMQEMSDIERIVEFPQYTSKMISSYDRRSVSPLEEGWYANDDYSGFIRYDNVNGRHERVLFDCEGPGAVTGIRITTTNKMGTLRFYFDGSDSPLIVAPAYDLTKLGFDVGEDLVFRHSSYRYPVSEIGGTSSYVPIPFAKGLKITLEEVVEDNKNYYQIEYRIYPQGTRVRTFSNEELLSAAKPVWESPDTISAIVNESIKLMSGDEISIKLPDGERIIDYISVSGYVPRELVASISFDGQQTVWGPVSDLFGAGAGNPDNICRYMRSTDQTLFESYWPMPYKQSAEITLKNLSAEPVALQLKANSHNYNWTRSTMYFHATWQCRKDVELCPDPVTPTNSIGREETLFEANGAGVYAGNLLSLFNHSKAWYGEGDEKIWIDNDRFPSYFGTGVEDYFNTSWAPVVLYHTLYGGALRADLPTSRGYNTFLRTRILDVIPFRSSIRFDMEMLGWTEGTVDYDHTSYWYGLPGAEANDKPAPELLAIPMPPAPASPKLYAIENAIEFEDAVQINKSPDLLFSYQDMSGFGFGDWSKASQITCFNCEDGDYIEFSFPGFLDDKDYEITFYGCKAQDYAIMNIYVNREQAISIDCYDREVRDTGACPVGSFKPMDGIFTLRFEVAGRNEKARTGKLLMGLDCIIIEEKL